MDLEELTKHQIILLTLLVSFVTSIATGIVTVSLMNQAPPEVQRTINQIVERTVETVAPTTQGAAVATEKTVVVKEDDLTASSIAAAQKAIIRITQKGGKELIARGVIVDSKGTALTDQDALVQSGANAFEAILADGTRVPVTVPEGQATTTPLAVVNVAVGTTTGWAPAALADPKKLALGQSVIRIGGVGADTVGEGVVATLPSGDNPTIIEASVSSATPGALLLNLFGQVVGITTADSVLQSTDDYTVATIPTLSATKVAPKP